MTTKALDLVTMGHALSELSATYFGDCQWRPTNDDQRQFLASYLEHRDEIAKLSGLEALASTDFTALNSFLSTRGFEPQFQQFDGVGVVSILDMMVEWLSKGATTTVTGYDRTIGRFGHTSNFPAFRINASGVDIFNVVGFEHLLVRLRTVTGHSLWLMKADEPASGIELALTAQRLLTARRTINPYWVVGVKVPMLEINVQPDLAWMIGMNTHDSNEEFWKIVQAFQQFKLRANERGARVKVATGFAMERSASRTPYEFDEPFIGCFTQPDNDTLPMAAFWADLDSWRNPEGMLEEL
jgi:hypothetical protein